MYQGKYAAKTTKPPKQKKKVRRGTSVFYSIYAAFVVLALVAIFALTIPLRSWLETYQASQPENKSQEIYDQLFADPDWEALYTLAGIADTAYEGKEAYCAYMEEKVGTDNMTIM